MIRLSDEPAAQALLEDGQSNENFPFEIRQRISQNYDRKIKRERSLKSMDR